MSTSPPERVVRTTVADSDAGTPLVELLAARFTYFSHASWSGMVRYGRITLNGQKTEPDTRVAAGDQIDFDATGIEEPPTRRSCRIIHQDTDILVVDKPADLPIHPAGRYFNNTLWALLREMTGIAKLHFINRLDRETSGLVLVAITKQAARTCSAQLHDHTLKKTYLALLEGNMEVPHTITGYMSRSTTPSGAFCMAIAEAPGEGTQFAETHFRPIQMHAGMTLTEVIPVTGRLHQIRVAADAAEYPIVGDKLYGLDPTIYDRLRADSLTPADRLALRLPRQALHASRLAFIHPISSRREQFHTPLPGDMRELIPQGTGGPVAEPTCDG